MALGLGLVVVDDGPLGLVGCAALHEPVQHLVFKRAGAAVRHDLGVFAVVEPTTPGAERLAFTRQGAQAVLQILQAGVDGEHGLLRRTGLLSLATGLVCHELDAHAIDQTEVDLLDHGAVEALGQPTVDLLRGHPVRVHPSVLEVGLLEQAVFVVREDADLLL